MRPLCNWISRRAFADSRLAFLRRLVSDAQLRQIATESGVDALGPTPDPMRLQVRESVREECCRRGRDGLCRVAGLSALRTVLEQIARIGRSRGFAAAPLLKNMLEIIVRHGARGEQLKEISIAAELERSGYDPATGGLRTELQRLRARLAEYYDGDGADDPVLIEIPKGGYAPRFAWQRPVRLADPVSRLLHSLYGFAADHSRQSRLARAGGLALVFAAWWLWMMSSVEYRVHWRPQPNPSLAAFAAKAETIAREGRSAAICSEPLSPSLERFLSWVTPAERLREGRCRWLEAAGRAASASPHPYAGELVSYLFFDPVLVVDKGVLWPLLLTLIFDATIAAPLLSRRSVRRGQALAGVPASAKPIARRLWGSERLVLLSAYASGVITFAQMLAKADSIDVNPLLAVGFGLAVAVFVLVFLQHFWQLRASAPQHRTAAPQKRSMALTLVGLSVGALAIGAHIGLNSAAIIGYPDTEGELQPFVALLNFVAQYSAVYGLMLLLSYAAAATERGAKVAQVTESTALEQSWTAGVWSWALVGAIVLLAMEQSRGVSEGQLWFHAAAAVPGTASVVVWLLLGQRLAGRTRSRP